MRRKLVVAIVGPTGAGKSTLLSALAGVDELSPGGVHRPTTRDVVVYAREPEDAATLVARLGATAPVRVASSPAAAGLEHVLLVDTPDFNSELAAAHRPIVEAVVRQADVLLVVLHAGNPKTRADAAYLAPLVAAFPARFVLVALNHADRMDEAELRADIVPDLTRHLEAAWDRAPSGVFCVSARRHLRRPDWPEGAAPRHAFDEWSRLRETIFGSLNRASVVVDARLERARHLVDAVRSAVREKAAALGGAGDVVARLRALHGAALADAASGLGEVSGGLGAGATALFYQRLAGAWWGPVGWLVGIWARLLLVGAGVLNVLRFGRPLRQIWGVATGLARFREARAAIDDAETGQGTEIAAARYRARFEREWPALADALVAAGFDPSVRDPEAVVPSAAGLEEALLSRWGGALDAELDRAARWLSVAPLQVLLNGVVLAPAVVVAVRSVTTFVAGELLSGDYFRHGLVTTVLLWLLAFVLLQMGARAVGGSRLLGRAFGRLVRDVREGGDRLGGDALGREVEAVRRLGSG
ncbi:MAG: 50S ribosome-binding GTPase [Deltaproteobacteria bacterium]|nr:50S ribosome-binding GTPase [Deltaproteobacteria bacterium]